MHTMLNRFHSYIDYYEIFLAFSLGYLLNIFHRLGGLFTGTE